MFGLVSAGFRDVMNREHIDNWLDELTIRSSQIAIQSHSMLESFISGTLENGLKLGNIYVSRVDIRALK